MEDIEYMVNKNADMRSLAYQRAAARKMERKLRNMRLFIGVLAAIALSTVIFGAFNVIHSTLCVIVATLAVIAGVFVSGQYVEVAKRK